MLFGGSQLPKLAKGLGSAQREFKKGLEEGADEYIMKPFDGDIVASKLTLAGVL